MASIMKGADIPVFITDMPEGLIIKRLDFSQKDHIVITKETDDFTVSGNEAQTVLEQKETIKFDKKHYIDIQLAYELNGLIDGTPTFENLFASNRFTATVSVSGLRIYVSDVCITDSYLTDVIDGIQPIKMNMLNPDIKCVDTNGNSYTCVWSTAHNRFEITIPDTNDRTYRVLVTV